MVKWFDYINQQRTGDPDPNEKVMTFIPSSDPKSKAAGSLDGVERIYIGKHESKTILGVIGSHEVVTCDYCDIYPKDAESHDLISINQFKVIDVRPSTGEFIAVYMNPSGIQSGKYRWNVDKGLQVLDEEGQKWMASDDFIDIKDLTAIYIIAGGDRYEI